MTPTSRRTFLKLSSLIAFVPIMGAQVLSLGQKAWAQAAALIDMSKTKRKDPTNDKAVGVAQGLGYVENADAAEKAGKIKRTDRPLGAGKTMPAKIQYCSNCMFFPQDKVNSTENGACQLIPGVLVHNKGYCNTFTPSPKAKV
jgi:hypothetical protein